MPLYKITEAVDITDPNLTYYGCPCVLQDKEIYADVPDYAVEDYIEIGRIFDVQPSGEEAPKVEEKTKEVETPKEDVKPVDSHDKDTTAKDVVDGTTEKSEEKKRTRRTKAEMAADKAAEVAKVKVKSILDTNGFGE